MCTGNETNFLYLSGNKGQHWLKANVSIIGIAIPNQYRVRITSAVGGFTSDAAIDDVTLKEGLCGEGNMSNNE